MEHNSEEKLARHRQRRANRVQAETKGNIPYYLADSASVLQELERMTPDEAAQFQADYHAVVGITEMVDLSDKNAPSPIEDSSLSKATLSAETFSAVEGVVAGADRLIATANEVNHQLFQEDEGVEESVTFPLLDQLRNSDRAPADMAVCWSVVGNMVLFEARKAIDLMSLAALGKAARQSITVVLPSKPEDDQAPAAEGLIGGMRFATDSAGDEFWSAAARIVPLYRRWQRSVRTLENWFHTGYLPEEGKSVAAAPERDEARIVALQAELEPLSETHAKLARPFRPTMSQLERAGLRPFSNHLLHLHRDGSQKFFLPAERAERRITGLLRSLEQIGQSSDPDAVQETFITLLSSERAIENKRRALDSLQASDPFPDAHEWLPVADELEFVQTHWDFLHAQLLERWSPIKYMTRQDAIASIERALLQYDQAKVELANPDRRLARIAQSLGSLTLPGTVGKEGAAADLQERRQAAESGLREIITTETLPAPMRQRAGVLLHFLNVATKQRQEGDNQSFGQLYVSEPTSQNPTRYFCVTFRAADGAEWTLMESLSRETATLVAPQRAVEEWGGLNDYVHELGRRDQQASGSRSVVHARKWTADSHVRRIMASVEAAGVNER